MLTVRVEGFPCRVRVPSCQQPPPPPPTNPLLPSPLALLGCPALRSQISHLSHIGGLLGGLLVSFLFLPNFKDQRWRAIKRRASRARQEHARTGSATVAAAQRSLERDAAADMSCWRRHRWVHYLVWTVSIIACLFFFLFLPLYIWLVRLPALQCPTPP